MFGVPHNFLTIYLLNLPIHLIFRKNYVDLRIYYEELNYELTEEIPAYSPSSYGCEYFYYCLLIKFARLSI